MSTYSKELLSGCTNGLGVVVSGSVSGSATSVLVHTAHSTAVDEVWLYAVNSSTGTVKLTVEWGELTAPNGNIEVNLEGETGLYLVIPGLLLTGALVIRAFASVQNAIILHGFVNRIT